MSRFCEVPRQSDRGSPSTRWWALAFMLCGFLLPATAVRGQTVIPLPDLLLGPGDVLPVLVGGPAPGMDHDLYVVSGPAELDGRVDLIFINGYEPVVGDEIAFLEAQSISRRFQSHFFPVFDALTGNDAALMFDQTPTTLTAKFVAPRIDNALNAAGPGTEWFDGANWLLGVPDSRDVLNLASDESPQFVQVFQDSSGLSRSAAVHRLRVGGSPLPTVMQIMPGVQFSATQRIDIDAMGLIELAGGRLVSNKIHVAPGGALRMNEGNLVTAMQTLEVAGAFSGTGSISGAVSVLDTGSFEVGLPASTTAGSIAITGDYQQASQGKLSMDVMSAASGNFDTLSVSGEAMLSGMLEVDMQGFTSLGIGQSIPLITASDIPVDSRFTKLELVDLTATGVYPAIEYTATSASLVGYSVGDMDRDNDRDTDDVDLFALALIDRAGYEMTKLPNNSMIGISADITGDTDYDGDMDFDDIDDLLLLLSPPAAAYARQVLLGLSVPEPCSGLLLVIGAAACCRRTRR